MFKMEVENNGVKWKLTVRELKQSELYSDLYDNGEEMVDLGIEEESWNLIYYYLTDDVMFGDNELILKSLKWIIMLRIKSLIEYIFFMINNGKFKYSLLKSYYNNMSGDVNLMLITDLYFLSLYKPIKDFDKKFKLLEKNIFDFKPKPYLLTYRTFFYHIKEYFRPNVREYNKYLKFNTEKFIALYDMYLKPIFEINPIPFTNEHNNIFVIDLTDINYVLNLFKHLPNSHKIYKFNNIYFIANGSFHKNSTSDIIFQNDHTYSPGTKYKITGLIDLGFISDYNNMYIIINNNKLYHSDIQRQLPEYNYIYTEDFHEF